MPAVDYLAPSNGSTVFAGVDFVIKAGCSDYLAYDPDYTFCNVYLNLGDATKSYHLTVSDYHEDCVYFVVPMDGRDFPSGYSPSDVVSVGADIYLADGTSSEPWADRVSTYVTYPVSSDPVITQQPQLSLGSQSGASVYMSWTAAEVQNQGDATIYYQYFVGPGSSYSDSYHIGTTTGLSHTLTEAEIISKCGNNFGANSGGSTCYLFVRAYWQKGQSSGGWVAVSGEQFQYYPTVNPPTDASLTPAKGKQTSVSWTNQLAGNNSQPQAVLRMLINGSWQNLAAGITSYNQGYLIEKSTWEQYGKGTYTICIAHEWYGRYANGSSMTFEFSPDNTIRLGNVDYVVMKYINNTWVAMDPYKYVSGEWKLCSTT